MSLEWAFEWVTARVVNRAGTVILAFLLATAVFATGLTGVETESGQEQFIEDLPSFEALEDVQNDFGDSFGEPTSSTTLVQDATNVLGKPALLRMLRAQHRIEEVEALRVLDASSPARTVARTLDPSATTFEAQIRAVEAATPGEIDAAVRRAAERNPGFTAQLSDDFNPQTATASAARGSVTHRAPGADGGGGGGGPGGGSVNPPNRVELATDAVAPFPDIRVLGTAPNTIADSLIIILPSALVFIVLFLIVAYRDPLDLLLGLAAIVLTLVWTFGFLGIAGIAFNVLLVAVPPLLIAVGIDFGIHAVNRYREERVQDRDINASMSSTINQLGVAFFIVMGTSAIGFLSNLVSAFPPTRDFGIAAAAGVLFTFLIFGVFLPAVKVYVDRLRMRYPVPTLSESPLGSQSSPLGRILSAGVPVAERAPVAFIVLLLIGSGGMGVYATGVDTGFSPDDFLPAEEPPEVLLALPEPFRPPEEFEYVKTTNFIDERFDEEGQVLMFVEGPMRRDTALEQLHRASADPPPTFEGADRRAEAQSIIDVIRAHAADDPEFRALVNRNDRNDNGIPDDNLPRIYAALEDSPAGDRVDEFLSDDRRSALVIYTTDGEAEDSAVTADAREVASDYRYDAVPTGNAVIFDEALGLIFESVVQTLVLTLIGAALFLVAAYWILEGRPLLGVANVVPIGMVVIALVASMRFFGISFNAINGTILAIVIGIGIDYSVHVVHRFADEIEHQPIEVALRRTVVGTGGALTGSMLTTVSGVGMVALALNPALGAFGVLTALSVFYAFLASVFVLPSVLILWARITGTTGPPAGPPGGGTDGGTRD